MTLRENDARVMLDKKTKARASAASAVATAASDGRATCRGEGAAGIRIAARFLADCAGRCRKRGCTHLRGRRRHDPWEHACCLLSGDFLCPTGDAFTDSLPVLGHEVE